jgi:hypothetical protein
MEKKETVLYRLCVPHECDNWSLISREATRLGVSDDVVLRELLGTEMEEVASQWTVL